MFASLILLQQKQIAKHHVGLFPVDLFSLVKFSFVIRIFLLCSSADIIFPPAWLSICLGMWITYRHRHMFFICSEHGNTQTRREKSISVEHVVGCLSVNVGWCECYRLKTNTQASPLLFPACILGSWFLAFSKMSFTNHQIASGREMLAVSTENTTLWLMEGLKTFPWFLILKNRKTLKQLLHLSS